MKAAQEQAVDDGDRPVEDSVYFVPSRREDLDDGVGEEDEDEGDDAVGGLAGVPEGDGQHDVCNRRTGSGWGRWDTVTHRSWTLPRMVRLNCSE